MKFSLISARTLLMLAVCMKSGMGKKCEQQATPAEKTSNLQTLDR